MHVCVTGRLIESDREVNEVRVSVNATLSDSEIRGASGLAPTVMCEFCVFCYVCQLSWNNKEMKSRP